MQLFGTTTKTFDLFYSCCFDISNSFYDFDLVLGTLTYFIAQRIRMGFYQLMRFINVIIIIINYNNNNDNIMTA